MEVGTERRQVVAGIAQHYAPEDLVGKSIIVVFNLQPAKLMGQESQGMLLAASDAAGQLVIVHTGRRHRQREHSEMTEGSLMFIDSHAHLTSREFDADREEVLTARGRRGPFHHQSRHRTSRTAGGPWSWQTVIAMVYAAVGFHPHEARLADDRSLAAIEELSAHPKVVAIGEIGLDFHYDFSPRDVQERVFTAQLDIAQRRDLPVIIHTRESLDETIAIVREQIAADPRMEARRSEARAAGLPVRSGVFHCYPGDRRHCLEPGGNGILHLAPGDRHVQEAGPAAEVAAGISTEHLLLETDSPYLAPVPHRGTSGTNRAYLPLIADRIAKLQHLTVDDVARSTSYGVFRLFGIGETPAPRFTYPLKNSLYINLTIRCNADCVFCDRKGEAVVKGHNLKIDREPSRGGSDRGDRRPDPVCGDRLLRLRRADHPAGRAEDRWRGG